MQILEVRSLRVIAAACDYLGKEAQDYKKQMMPAGGRLPDEAGYYHVEIMRYRQIDEALGKDVLTTALDLAVAQFVYPSFYHFLKKMTKQGATLALSYRLCQKKHPDYLTCREDYEKLTCYLQAEKKAENFLYSELFADRHLALFLAGEDELPEIIQDDAELFLSEMDEVEEWYGMDQWLARLRTQISIIQKKSEPCVLQIRGSEGRGRKTLIKKLAMEDGGNWIFVDCKRLLRSGKQLSEKLWQIRREKTLYQAGICLYHFEEKMMDELLMVLRQMGILFGCCRYPVCICTLPDVQLVAEMSCPIQVFTIPESDRQERIELWKGYSKSRGLLLNWEEYGIRYRLNPGDIRKIFCGLEFTVPPKNKQELDRLIAGLCTEVRGVPKNGRISPISFSYTMEDLKLEPAQKEQLRSISNHVFYSRKVYDEWDMERKYPYGKGITALFAGPPGTGKTMAASVLSAELCLPLYTIDLSQIVDKYIGETEKRLEEVFEYAARSNVILFFDEADSLFGKRTEVKDSKDKYANNEVSYLLQKIERHEGLVLLATNIKNNIDEAFLRRMRYVVEFQLPDVETRKEIWKNGFSAAVPVGNLDFDLLAKEVELSGGYIRNIILNAMFDAAGDHSQVTMYHVIKSVCNEYRKLGKMVSIEEFERFGVR